MTAPTVPTAPLPSILPCPAKIPNHIVDKVMAYMTMAVNSGCGGDDARAVWRIALAQIACDLVALTPMAEQLAASERTCAELRASIESSVAGMNALSMQSAQIVDENAKLRARARAEAAERTVEGLRGKP